MKNNKNYKKILVGILSLASVLAFNVQLQTAKAICITPITTGFFATPNPVAPNTPFTLTANGAHGNQFVITGPGVAYTGAGGIVTAPGITSASVYTAELDQVGQCADSGNSITITVNVQGAPPPVPGRINVASINSLLTSVPVPASWDFGAAQDPCLTASCSGLSVAAYDAPLGSYTIVPLQAVPSTNHYAFNKIESFPNAPKLSLMPKGIFANLFALSGGLLGSIAEAFSFPLGNPPSQTLSAANLTANFIILWDPMADIGFNPASVGLSSGTPSAPVSISNSGAPGSTLTWTATVPAPWLSVSVPSGALTNGASGNASQSITVTANPATAPAAPTTVNIDFTIQSSPGSFSPTPVRTVSIPVTYGGAPPSAVCGDGVVQAPETCDQGAANGICPASCSKSCTTNTCPPPPSCTFTASPSAVVVPEQTNLNYNCVNVTTCTLSGGQFGVTGVPLTVTGTTAAGAKAASPSADTTYSLSCYGEEPPPGSNTNYQQNVNVKVTVQAPGRVETTP